jgi:hypothetical protein
VKCDAGTHGLVNVVVGFAPLKPAEFVTIQLQQTAGQAGGARQPGPPPEAPGPRAGPNELSQTSQPSDLGEPAGL